MMEELNIDYKFSIKYDTDDNDRPVRWMRYGEEWSASTKWEENNAVTAMFYRMLEDRAEITQLRTELEQERVLADRLAEAMLGIVDGKDHMNKHDMARMITEAIAATRRNK